MLLPGNDSALFEADPRLSVVPNLVVGGARDALDRVDFTERRAHSDATGSMKLVRHRRSLRGAGHRSGFCNFGVARFRLSEIALGDVAGGDGGREEKSEARQAACAALPGPLYRRVRLSSCISRGAGVRSPSLRAGVRRRLDALQRREHAVISTISLESLVGECDFLASLFGDGPSRRVGRKPVGMPLADEAPVSGAQRLPLGVGRYPEDRVVVRVVTHGIGEMKAIRGTRVCT